jgi:hypothetical protein
MTAVSISTTRGALLGDLADFTVGTSAPAAGDMEFKYNLLDTNSAAITRKDLQLFLRGLERVLAEKDLLTNAPPL